MPETTSNRTSVGSAVADAQVDRVILEQLGRSLDEWRARIDELIVQVDLADLGIREEVRKRLNVTENAYLAARNRLSDVPSGVGSNLGSLVKGLEQLLADLGQAYQAAEAVVRRGQPD